VSGEAPGARLAALIEGHGYDVSGWAEVG